VGAWTDAYPLTVPELRAEHTHFFFIDKHPLHQESKMRLTEAAIFEELVRKSGGAVGPAVHLGDRWEAPLRGGTSRLVYYLNTLDTDLVRDPPAWLPTVRTLFVAGFNPCPELVRALPNLRCAISTYMCKYAPPGQLSPWYRALPEGTAWRPMTQPDLEDGVWVHHLWVKDDIDKYPLTEMPSVWFASEEEEEEEAHRNETGLPLQEWVDIESRRQKGVRLSKREQRWILNQRDTTLLTARSVIDALSTHPCLLCNFHFMLAYAWRTKALLSEARELNNALACEPCKRRNNELFDAM
jgi:hypothetical protein